MPQNKFYPGAFYPNLFGRSSPKNHEYEREAFNAIAGRDLQTTVYFKGFEQKYIRNLYIQSIKELFVRNGVVDREDLSNVKVTFDEGSQKVFVTFKNNQRESTREYGSASLPGRILTEVYAAVKMRMLRIPTKIRVIKYVIPYSYIELLTKKPLNRTKE